VRSASVHRQAAADRLITVGCGCSLTIWFVCKSGILHFEQNRVDRALRGAIGLFCSPRLLAWLTRAVEAAGVPSPRVVALDRPGGVGRIKIERYSCFSVCTADERLRGAKLKRVVDPQKFESLEKRSYRGRGSGLLRERRPGRVVRCGWPQRVGFMWPSY